MKVICINDQGKPNEIPSGKWLEKGSAYTVKNIIKCNTQGGALGFELEEIDLTGCEPYLYFMATRFAIPKEDIANKESEFSKRGLEEEVLA